MSFSRGDRVEFTDDWDSAKTGDCGKIVNVLSGYPPRYQVHVTHEGPDCEEVKQPFDVTFVPENILKPCHC